MMGMGWPVSSDKWKARPNKDQKELNYNGMPEFMMKRSMLEESQVYKKWQTSTVIWEISDFNLETGRYGPKSGVSRIIQEI